MANSINIKNFGSGLSKADFSSRYHTEHMATNRSLTQTQYQNELDNAWTAYSFGQSSDKTPTKNTGVMSSIGDMGKSLLSMSEAGQGFPDQTKKLSTGYKEVLNLIENLKSPLGVAKALTQGTGLVVNEITTYYQQQSALLDIINKKTGLTGEFAENIRQELTRANPQLELMGISFDELARSASDVVSNSGRFVALNRETWTEAGYAATAYVGSLSELVAMYPEFEKVGIGAGSVAKQIDIVGKRSVELGLQSQKTTKDLNANLSKLNEYGFKNGVQGLSEMVRRSTELRMNMSEVFKIAEKVFEPEGAIDLAANLQAIGGAIGDFNDPLKLMYMATNNVEGLGTALEGVAGSLATYNQEQGRFEITGVNLRRARALAKELGVEYGQLANAAIASAERTSAASDLMATGLSLDEDQKRFLTNISTMKDGKMTIELQSDKLRDEFGRSEIAIEDLSKSQVERLISLQNEFKKLSTEDIVRKQATDVENINRGLTFLVAVARQRVVESGSKVLVDSINKFLGGGYDLNNLGKDISKQVREAGESIKTKSGNIESKNLELRQQKLEPSTKLKEENMKSGYDRLKETYDEIRASINNKETQPKKLDISLNYNSPNMLDNLSRGLFRSPEFVDTIKNGIIDDKSYV